MQFDNRNLFSGSNVEKHKKDKIVTFVSQIFQFLSF